jgi:hypothetical protein
MRIAGTPRSDARNVNILDWGIINEDVWLVDEMCAYDDTVVDERHLVDAITMAESYKDQHLAYSNDHIEIVSLLLQHCKDNLITEHLLSLCTGHRLFFIVFEKAPCDFPISQDFLEKIYEFQSLL